MKISLLKIILLLLPRIYIILKLNKGKKKEGHQRIQKYDFSQPQRYIKSDSNNQNKIKSKEMVKTKTQNMSMNGRYFNNEFNRFYDNNDSNNIYDNSKKENEHIKKINIRQISENKVMRHYISPKTNIRYQYPGSSILNQSEISSNSPKTIQSMSHAFIANNNKKKNNDILPYTFNAVPLDLNISEKNLDNLYKCKLYK